MRNVIIVASGPSADGFVPPDNAIVIAVNGAIDWIARSDYWFTLDPSPANTCRMTNRRDGVAYCAAVAPDYPLPLGIKRLDRMASRGKEPRRNTPEWWFWRWSCKHGLAESEHQINTGNSAYGALGLAYHMRPDRIVLVGVDGSDEPRVEGGQCNNLSHLPMLFASAVPQLARAGISVANASPHSKIDCFPRITRDEALAWIR